MIRYIKNNEWRVMQCVVKPYSKNISYSTEYPAFFDQLENLPDGLFLLNLTDAILLRKDGREPWPMVTGDKLLSDEFNFSTHLPILGCSGATGYWDIPIPNYDDVRFILGLDTFPKLETNWDNKISKAIFRGSATGCGITTSTNMRLKLSTIKSDLLDAGVTVSNSRSLRFDPKFGLGYLKTDIKPVSFLSMEEQSKYKYIINIDGNVGAYRLLKFFLVGSLILKVDGIYKLWIEDYIMPNVHYIPVKSDLSDLLDVIKWCCANDDKCRQIAVNSYNLAKKILTKEFINKEFVKILSDLVR
jgi:hypothetical protein